jgi:ABC-2 type transport system permease protein
LTNLVTLTRMRMRLAMRNKMFFFFSVIMPTGIFFLYAGVFAKSIPSVVQYLLGPALSFNVMGSFWGLSAALVMFREQGILRRFHVCPVKETDMLISSLLANCLLMLPIIGMELIFAKFLFHVPSVGNLLSVGLLAVIGIVSFGSLGLVIASVTNTMQETQVLNQLLWLPLIFLSGATIPFTALSNSVQQVALFLPATYLVHGFKQSIMDTPPARPGQLWVIFVSLIAWFLLTLFLSSQLFRWEPEAKIGRKAKLYVLATAIPFFLLGVFEVKNGRVIAQEKVLMQKFDDTEQQQRKQEAPKPDKPTAAPEKR